MVGHAEPSGEVCFRILGPLDLIADTVAVPLGGKRQRALLAHLLLNVNLPVATDRLIAAVWPREQPASAAANLQTYVSRLRKVFPPLPDGEGLVTTDGHYAMVLGPRRLDATVFERLVAEAQGARRDGDPEGALACLENADALWRGAPLQDLAGPGDWDAEIGRLIEARLAATEERLALRIELGGHERAGAELVRLLVAHPYRERLWQQQMLALSRAGRRAEALALYRTVRDRFVAELGVEPGEQLRVTHRAILRGEHVGPPDRPVTVRRDAVARYQLPLDLPDFTGRTGELDELADAVRPTSSAPTVTVFAGPPGIGKSALAVHLAHRVAQRFPDGQLYADLKATRAPADVLADFLQLLGVVGAALPAGLDARAALFRSRLVGCRVLLVLDDAADAEQVRPLLPAEPRCAVLITTRNRLSEVDGVRQVPVDVLPAADAELLLGRIAGADRVAAEPGEAAAIVRSCGYFPLAIRIAGARLAGRRGWSLRTLRTRLADESSRLDELRVGQRGARSSFDLSVRQLPAAAVEAFARLSLLGGQEFPEWMVTALLDQQAPGPELDLLVDANLVAPAGSARTSEPRYRLHDLIRWYAAELVRQRPAAERDAAVRRVVQGLRSLAAAAAGGLPVAFGARRPATGGWRLPDDQAGRLTAAPLLWFSTSRHTVMATVELAADSQPDLAWQLAAAAVPYYDLRGEYDEWRRGHELALAAARAADDVVGEATMLRGLGQVHLYRDEYDQARDALAGAVDRFRVADDRWGMAVATAGLGTIARVRDDPDAALRHYRAALTGLTATGDANGQAQVLSSIGAAHLRAGRSGHAEDWLRRALALATEIGDAHREAKVLGALAELYRARGDLFDAMTVARSALSILEGLDDERCTAHALVELGNTLLVAGHPRAAGGVAERALGVFRRTGNGRGERTALALIPRTRTHRGRG